ncbi:MAG TPA: alcohol dehydrogenase catalytic domain-containing protein [Thermoplasmata archaeon]|nr:alcohol dehydrogenase catalytic domain-containing protein [Thermoplasmata archaeon]
MKAVLLRGTRGLVVEEVPDPEAAPGEIVVSMRACGLCGSDLEKIRGTYTAAPPVIGHEAVGVVAEVGDGVERIRKGARVFPHHHVPCGRCATCRGGSPTMCVYYRATNLEPGGFAESFRVPRWNVEHGGVLRLPPSVDFERASFIEPLACAIRAVDRARAKARSALVLGVGPMGLLALQLLRLRGTQTVFASEVSPLRAEKARGLGAASVWDPTKEDVPALARKETAGLGVDAAVVATGNVRAIAQAVHAVRAGGTVVLLGVPEVGSRLDVDPSVFVTREVSVISSNAATEVETRKALELIVTKKVDVASLVTHRFRLAEFPEAVRVAERAECVKAILTP